MEEANSSNKITLTSSGVAHPDASKTGNPLLQKLEVEKQATSDDQEINLLAPSGKILKLISNWNVAAATDQDQTVNILTRSSIITGVLEVAIEVNITSDDLQDEDKWGDDNQRFPDGIQEMHRSTD